MRPDFTQKRVIHEKLSLAFPHPWLLHTLWGAGDKSAGSNQEEAFWTFWPSRWPAGCVPPNKVKPRSREWGLLCKPHPLALEPGSEGLQGWSGSQKSGQDGQAAAHLALS